MFVRTRSAALAAALILCSVGAGCGAGGDDPAGAAKPSRSPAEALPSPDEFRTGTCRSAADHVLWLAGLARRAGDAKTLSRSDRDGLVTHQNALFTLLATAETEIREPLSGLLTAAGYVRLTSDTRSYRPQYMRGLDEARRRLQSSCVS